MSVAAARPRRRSWRPRISARVQDLAVAVIFAGIAIVEKGSDDTVRAGPPVVNLLITGTVVALLALRRAAPVRVLVLTAAVIGLPILLVRHDFFVWSHMAPLIIDTYTVARMRGAGVALLTMLAVFPCLGLVFAVLQPWDPQALLWSTLFFGVIVVGSRLRRSALVRAALSEARDRLAAIQVERERAVILRERARLALELQDTVSAAVSLMTAQAAAAQARLSADPNGARSSVLALERAGREATGDLRRMLGLLRTEDDDGTGRPVPSLDALQELSDLFAAAGLPVALEVRGAPGALSAAFGVTAYRLIHDALAVAVAHRPRPARAVVTVEYGDSVVLGVHVEKGTVEMTRSIRERVRMLRGTIEERPQGVLLTLPRPEGQ